MLATPLLYDIALVTSLSLRTVWWWWCVNGNENKNKNKKKRLNLEVFLLACCDHCDKICINIRNEKQNEREKQNIKTKAKEML